MSLPTTSRYELLVRVASGGMATVYVGRLSGAVGFWKLVAVKRAHAHLLEDESFTRMLVAEAWLASKIRHPNVVSVHDVEELDGELLLIMDYVEGTSFSTLISRSIELGVPIPLRVALRIVIDACVGLHAAHRVTDDDGKPLNLVHRDVSPHNILVGLDGIARIADFGIAKATTDSGVGNGTTTGALKGKVAYMAPEYIETSRADARADVFALGIVLWEAITQKRLFRGNNDIDTLRLVVATDVKPPSSVAPGVSARIDGIVMNALAQNPAHRYQTAAAFAEAIEAAARDEGLLATPEEVGAVVRDLVGDSLAERRALIRNKIGSKGEGGNAKEPEFTAADQRTPTLPISSSSASATDPIIAPPFEMGTLTTNAASRSIEPPRLDAPKRGSPAWLAIGVPLLVIAGLGTGAFFVVHRLNLSVRNTEASTNVPLPSTSAASVAADLPIGSATAGAGSAPPPASPSLPTTSPPAASAAHAKPPTSATAATGPGKNKPISHPPPPVATPRNADKAPPNPYGH